MVGERRRVEAEPPLPQPSGRPVIFLSVGEPSGDLHGASLAHALRARFPHARLLGLGGPRMAAAGVELLADVNELAVMGFAEVVARLPFFVRLRRVVYAAVRAERVDLVIPVDYPGFNLRLARRARAWGIPVLYYIAPQVWAWHASRALRLARDANRVAVVLPFEEAFLREAGAEVEFVGHPLLDLEPFSGTDREGWFAEHGLDAARPLLALFPGSRMQEIDRHLAVFEAAGRRVVGSRPDVQVVIGAPEALPEGAYRSATWPVTRASQELLRHASAALVKSGTTTLEAALAGVPFAVAYRTNPLTYLIAKRLVRVPHIALANLVAGSRVVPEFVQGEAEPATLAASLLPLLDEGSPERIEMLAGLAGVREALGRGGAAARVAAIAAELLGSR